MRCASAATLATADLHSWKRKKKKSDHDELLNICRFILTHHLFAKHPLTIIDGWRLVWLINLLRRHRINYRHIISNWCNIKIMCVRVLLEWGAGARLNTAVSLCLLVWPLQDSPMLIGLQLEELYYDLYDFITDLVLGDLQLVMCCE